MSHPDELPDASDVVTTNNRSRDQARYARSDADVLRKLMHDAPGRAWLYRILEACHIYESPFVPGQADSTAFKLGEQNVGRRLLAQVTAASGDLYMTMLKEARAEEARIAKENVERNRARLKEEEEVASAGGAVNVDPPPGFK